MKTHKLECLNTTILSFMNKHPFFHNDVTSYRDIRRSGNYFKLIFQTEIEGNVQEVVYELSLEKGDTDCQCVLVSPENLIDGVGLVRPEDMSVLVNKIKTALVQCEETILEDILRTFEVYEHTHCFVKFYKKEIVLTYQSDNTPVFFQNGKFGDDIHFTGGQLWYGDCNFTVAHFIISLITGRASWIKNIEVNSHVFDARSWMNTSEEQVLENGYWSKIICDHYSEMDVEFDKVVRLCNQAMQHNEKFSFSEFVSVLSHWDQEIGESGRI